APTSVTLVQASSATVTVHTAVTSGNAQTVSLSVSGLPSGGTGTLSPTSVTAGGSSTLTLSASATATLGTSNFTVTGTATSGSHAAAGSLTITTAGNGEDTVLMNGVAVTGLSGAQNSQVFFRLDVPSGASNLSFHMSGGTGDADLYMRFG